MIGHMEGAASSPHASDTPTRIGPYDILGTLGRGGMGVVYLAEQTEPVRRKVALKVIKLGMDTRQILNRFEAERQALAMMEHGSIARIYDCGATERGQPYFAWSTSTACRSTRTATPTSSASKSASSCSSRSATACSTPTTSASSTAT